MSRHCGNDHSIEHSDSLDGATIAAHHHGQAQNLGGAGVMLGGSSAA